MIFWTVFVHALVESFELRVWQFYIKVGSLVQVAYQCKLFAEFSFVVSTTDIVTTQVCQFQKDRVEQAQCGFLFSQSRDMSTADILAMKVRQFQKDRDEQAQCESTCCKLFFAVHSFLTGRHRCFCCCQFFLSVGRWALNRPITERSAFKLCINPPLGQQQRRPTAERKQACVCCDIYN